MRAPDIKTLSNAWERELRRRLPALEREARRIEQGALREASRFYELGEALSAWKSAGSYRLLGFRSFSAYVAARAKMSRATAYKLIAVATALDKARAEQLGFERAYALVRLGGRAPRAAAELSVRTLRARAPRAGAPAAVRAAAAELERALGAGAIRVRVVARGRGWRVAVELGAEEGRALARRVRGVSPFS